MTDDIHKIINSLSDKQKEMFLKVLQEDAEEEVTNVANKQNVVNADFTVNRVTPERGDRKVRGKKNTWVDTGSNLGDDRDLTTPMYEPTVRNRQKPKKQKVECHVCGRTFSVNPSLTYGEFHRCDKCTGGR